MNRIIIPTVLLTISGSSFASDLTPAWINNPPVESASACSSLSHGELTATKIAKAKALAELSRTHQAEVKSNQQLNNEVHNGKLTDSSYKETTEVSSNETFKHAEIIEQAIVEMDGGKQLCVLVGTKNKEIAVK